MIVCSSRNENYYEKIITLIVLLLSFTYTCLQAQNLEDVLEENTPRETAFGLKTSVRFGQTNFADTTILSPIRIGYSIGAVFHKTLNKDLFINVGVEHNQGKYIDNLQAIEILESNNAISTSFNYIASQCKKNINYFGVSSGIEFTNRRKITSGAESGYDDPEFRSGDYRVPLKFVMGVIRKYKKSRHDFTFTVGGNIYSSNTEGAIANNVIVVEVGYAYFF